MPLFKVCGGASPSCRRNPLALGRGGSQEILYRLKHDAESIYHLEKILLKGLEKHKYKPRKRFGGESECFSTIEPILYILEKINMVA